MAKNNRFWPFYLVFYYSTVTTSILMLQNVSYHHTEQYLQTWSAHRCLKGLIIAKNGPKMVKNGWFEPSRLDSSSSTITTSLLVLQSVSYYHTEHYLQIWSAHRCLKWFIFAKNGPIMTRNGQTQPYLTIIGTCYSIIRLLRYWWALHVCKYCSVW